MTHLRALACLAAVALASGCDLQKTAKDAQACAPKNTECSTAAGGDVCKVIACGIDGLACTVAAYSDNNCCKEGEASIKAATDAWNTQLKAYKDQLDKCDKKSFDGECKGGGGGGGSSSGAATTKASLFGALLLAAGVFARA